MTEVKIDHQYEYVRRDIENHRHISNEFDKIEQQLKRIREAQQQFEKLNDIHNSNRTPVVLIPGSTGSQQF